MKLSDFEVKEFYNYKIRSIVDNGIEMFFVTNKICHKEHFYVVFNYRSNFVVVKLFNFKILKNIFILLLNLFKNIVFLCLVIF